MPTQTRTKPRKTPTQPRSKVTVDAILSAAARILVDQGYENANTNRIAEKAGVSIGSLYQYFPSKESIIAALVDQMFQGAMAILIPRFERAGSLPLADAVRELVEAMIDYHRVNPALRKAILEQVPRTGKLAEKIGFEARIASLVAEDLKSRGSEIRPGLDPALASFTLVHAIQGVIHAATSKRPEYLKDDRLLDDITRMAVEYVARPSVRN